MTSPHPTPAEGTPIGTPETDHSAFTVKAGSPISPVHDWSVVHADKARSLETRLITTQSRLEEAEELLRSADSILSNWGIHPNCPWHDRIRAHLARHQTSGGSKP